MEVDFISAEMQEIITDISMSTHNQANQRERGSEENFQEQQSSIYHKINKISLTFRHDD